MTVPAYDVQRGSDVVPWRTESCVWAFDWPRRVPLLPSWTSPNAA